MSRHRTPPLPRRDVPRRFVATATGAVFGIVCPPLVLVAQASAPKVESSSIAMPAAEETVPRPHMGPLVLPSIGAEGAWTPPEELASTPTVTPDAVDGSRMARNTVRIATKSPVPPSQPSQDNQSTPAPVTTAQGDTAVPTPTPETPPIHTAAATTGTTEPTGTPLPTDQPQEEAMPTETATSSPVIVIGDPPDQPALEP